MSQASAPLPLSPSALVTFKEALGCSVIGTILSTAVYGITVLQAYNYLRHSSHDSVRTRWFVALVFGLDTVTMILTLYGFYGDFVTNYGDASAFLSIPPTLALENVLTVLIGALTQCFFAHRLWTLSKRNVLLTSGIVILALCSFGKSRYRCSAVKCRWDVVANVSDPLVSAISVHLYTNTYIFSLGSLEIRILAGFANGLSMICDLVIAAGLCYYINTKRTGFRRTDSIIDRLMIYAINRGLLTATCQACHMIMTVALPGRQVYLPFALLDGKLYCNTLLATLNAQRGMRGHGTNIIEVGTHMFDSINTPAPGNGTHSNAPGQLASGSSSMPTIVSVMDFSIGKVM